MRIVVFAIALCICGPTVNRTSASQLTIKATKPVQKQTSVLPDTQVQATPAPEPVPQAPAPEPAPQAPVVAAPAYASGSHEDWMSQAGISPTDYGAVDYIVSHESGWCPYKHEGEWGVCPSTPNFLEGHAYGICQALPGTKMSAAGDDWLNNPVTQLRWCNSYAQSSYGGWWGAYTHWTNYQWW